jgi:hypothetical protein
MDMLLNNLQTRQQILQAFPIDCLEKFKGIVDTLMSILTWRGRKCEISLLATLIDRIKTFFDQLRKKLQYQSRVTLLNNPSQSRIKQNIMNS